MVLLATIRHLGVAKLIVLTAVVFVSAHCFVSHSLLCVGMMRCAYQHNSCLILEG